MTNHQKRRGNGDGGKGTAANLLSKKGKIEIACSGKEKKKFVIGPPDGPAWGRL